jgi:hypothetical protein
VVLALKEDVAAVRTRVVVERGVAEFYFKFLFLFGIRRELSLALRAYYRGNLFRFHIMFKEEKQE